MSKPIMNNIFDGRMMFILKPLTGVAILLIFGIKTLLQSVSTGFFKAFIDALKDGMINLASKAFTAIKYITDYKSIPQDSVSNFGIWGMSFILSFLTMYLIISPLFDVITGDVHIIIKTVLLFAIYTMIAMLILFMFHVQIGENIQKELSDIPILDNIGNNLSQINQTINQTIDIDLTSVVNETTNVTGSY